MTIAELLEELKKYDMDVWRSIHGFRIMHQEKTRKDFCIEQDMRFQYELQGILQQVIAARGWTLQQNNFLGKPCMALVDGRYWGESNSPAGALLAAYVKALYG